MMTANFKSCNLIGVGMAAPPAPAQSNDNACISIYVSGLPTDIVEEDVGKNDPVTY